MEKICSKCKNTKDIVMFDSCKTGKNGIKAECKACIKIRNDRYSRANGSKKRKFSDIKNGTKLCTDCNEYLPFDSFDKNRSSLGNLRAHCKSCSKNRYYTKEKSRVQTQKYRDENREYWRSKHRINQAERRYKIKVQSDGTVTPAFCKKIYSKEICYFCNEFTPYNKRTLEHKESIFKGGLHSSSNIEMACISCNFSKREKSEQEFALYKLKA